MHKAPDVRHNTHDALHDAHDTLHESVGVKNVGAENVGVENVGVAFVGVKNVGAENFQPLRETPGTTRWKRRDGYEQIGTHDCGALPGWCGI